ncbi:hypothetical protein ACQBAU_00555 [Propionibacteriaceae bacterium Y2011]
MNDAPDTPQLSRRTVLHTTTLAGAAIGLGLPHMTARTSPAYADAPPDLPALGDHPRALHFRNPENALRGANPPGYEDWERVYSSLNGIIVKAMSDDAYRPPVIAEFANRLKLRHPEQLVMAHVNGFSRVPTHAPHFFAGHWLYKAGTTLTQPAAPDDTVLHVADPSVFSVGVGSYRDRGDDVGITLPADPGSQVPWRTAEQVSVVAIDTEANTITVTRGKYGTSSLPWAEGDYLAAHVVAGPYGPADSTPLAWHYNFTTTCPRDASGRNCADALVAELTDHFSPDGLLENFDGAEFDVHFFTLEHSTQRDADADADGVADRGILDGANVQGLGVLALAEKLRERFPTKVFTADGHYIRHQVSPNPASTTYVHQRNFATFNGIETEGFLDQNDYEVAGWSEALNILDYWHSRTTGGPRLSYVQQKYLDEMPPRNPVTRFTRLRLMAAGAVLTGSALGQLTRPEFMGTIDELTRGTDGVLNWLGQPVGHRIRMATHGPDLFHNQGRRWSQSFVARFYGSDVATIAADRGRGIDGRTMLIRSTAGASTALPGDEMTIRIPDVDVPGPDLCLKLQVSVDPLAGYPSAVARYVRCRVGDSLQSGWANPDGVELFFYHRDIGPGTVDLEFIIEGHRDVVFEDLQAYGAPDLVAQEFDNGLVLANPSTRPATFDLTELVPGRSYRRLTASELQDGVTNDGSPVGATVTLEPIDGLFLVRQP